MTFSVAKVNKLLVLAFLSAAFVLVLKLENGFVIGIESYGGIECLTRFAAPKTFDYAGLAVYQQVGKLCIGQILFGNAAEDRQLAMFVVTFGDFLINVTCPFLHFGQPQPGAVIGTLKRNIDQFRSNL